MLAALISAVCYSCVFLGNSCLDVKLMKRLIISLFQNFNRIHTRNWLLGLYHWLIGHLI